MFAATSQIHSGRKLLVLDLDETLVHSSFKPVSHSDYVLDIMVDSTSYKVHMHACIQDCVKHTVQHASMLND
jgi:TFIIF-interacting CTD phosphatase-like protein